MAAFTLVMRTHEGNRPDTNFQFYDDEDCMRAFGRLSQIHAYLKPYLREAVAENSERGIPVQRPFFLYYSDERDFSEQFSYLLGRDILVAPIYEKGAESRKVYLPEDRWVELWTGKEYSGGEYEIAAPMGYPPVFYRKESSYRILFEGLRAKFSEIA